MSVELTPSRFESTDHSVVPLLRSHLLSSSLLRHVDFPRPSVPWLFCPKHLPARRVAQPALRHGSTLISGNLVPRRSKARPFRAWFSHLITAALIHLPPCQYPHQPPTLCSCMPVGNTFDASAWDAIAHNRLQVVRTFSLTCQRIYQFEIILARWSNKPISLTCRSLAHAIRMQLVLQPGGGVLLKPKPVRQMRAER
jgi:hypothetical protein